jgi:hypothetical protein
MRYGATALQTSLVAEEPFLQVIATVVEVMPAVRTAAHATLC